MTRGLPQLRPLRALMAQVYAQFDRRCRTQTALDKLAKLRRRLLRFTQVGETLKKRFSPTLEKALTFLDDTLLPSTSNAVERGNRRYRKMQKQVAGYVRKHRSVHAWRWTCGAKPKAKDANKRISSIIREVKAYMWESCHYQRKRA